MNPRSYVFVVVLVGGLVSPGVAEDSAPAAPANPASATEPSPVPSPEKGPAEGAAEGSATDAPVRDPFRPFLNLRRRGTVEAPKVGLQAYDVRQLRLVAVLWDMNPPRALVQDAAGMGFIVGPGTPIGRKDGVVAVIEPGRIVVEEKTVDIRDNVQLTREIMEIPREDEPQRVGREQ